MPRLVLISDTHGIHDQLDIPPGDVLVHAGDMDAYTLAQVLEFDAWLARLPHPTKIVVAGNHDAAFVRQPQAARAALRHATYLEDEGATAGGLTFYGSPWQPRFCDMCFNLDRGAPLAEVWARIPPGTDVLVTHGPPAGILDRTLGGEAVGCEDLRRRVEALAPRLHVFGHIHESRGTLRQGPTTFVNAAVGFSRRGAPVVIDL